MGEPIPPNADEKVTRVITIPHDMEPSILSCSNIKVEYRLRVSICMRRSLAHLFLCDCAQIMSAEKRFIDSL